MTGAPLIPTQGSWRPLVPTTTASPSALTVAAGDRIRGGGSLKAAQRRRMSGRTQPCHRTPLRFVSNSDVRRRRGSHSSAFARAQTRSFEARADLDPLYRVTDMIAARDRRRACRRTALPGPEAAPRSRCIRPKLRGSAGEHGLHRSPLQRQRGRTSGQKRDWVGRQTPRRTRSILASSTHRPDRHPPNDQPSGRPSRDSHAVRGRAPTAAPASREIPYLA